MSLEIGLESLIAADTTLAALIGDRIYPVVVPDDATYPCLSYQVVSGDSDASQDESASYIKRVQFDGWARTYKQVKLIEAGLTDLLDGFVGNLPNGVRVISSDQGIVVDGWEASRFFRCTLDFKIEFA